MDPTLLDTDILSEVFRSRNRTVAIRAATYRRLHNRLTLSTLSIVEVVKGFAQTAREDRIIEFLGLIQSEEVLTLDRESAEIAGRIQGLLEARGLPIGRVDPLIAAIAIRNGLILATGNTVHYQRVQQLGFGLRLIDWRV